MNAAIKFKAVISNIAILDNPWGEKTIKLDITEEREVPGPLIVQRREGGELSREIVPIISQVLKSMPIFGSMSKVRVPRITLYLTEDEWDKILAKPNIGDTIEVEFTSGKISIKKS